MGLEVLRYTATKPERITSCNCSTVCLSEDSELESRDPFAGSACPQTVIEHFSLRFVSPLPFSRLTLSGISGDFYRSIYRRPYI
ncbi:hypothetical protein H6P81_014639 [Aristolochia fimbriata]|uniref:Uncharacterized protein n=1 Tax=Aristolochia fimbriata TaxID=158543 RepID=A0AAV7E394_ARIFI|nr:hypothetical protein H6P81_014639 [Aristolochia fimbriata]